MRLNETRRSKPAISLTPLIDVVFLLLIFFMLVSTFLKFNTLPVTAVESGPAAAAADKSETVVIEIFGGQRIEINGVKVELGGLLAHINELVARGMTKAVVKAMPGVTVQDLVSVIERARNSTLKSVVITR